MKRGFLTLSLLALAGFSAVAPARAQHEERREERHEEHPKPRKKRPPVARPKAKPKPAAPAKPRGPVLQQHALVPQQRAPIQKGPQVPPTPSRPNTPVSPPKTPGASAQVRVQPLPKPEPITDPKHFVHHWAPPPAPATNAAGGAITATPITQVPSSQHTTVFNNSTVITTIISNQQNEVSPNRYYWHRDGGFDYVHYYHGGSHWYGFYVGPNYYWSQYHASRWWWYDPIMQRYLYFHGGYWWWQDPNQPQALWVYQSGAYVAYDVFAAASVAAPTVQASVAPAPAAAVAPAVPPAAKYHSDVDAPNYSVDPNANRFALVVGVEDYANLPKAAFAGRDAEAVRAHLSALGYPDQNVAVLTGTQTARESIAHYVEWWLPRSVKDQSRVFVYFAGRGAPDPKTGVAYLLPRDGDVNNLASTGYSLKQLYAALNALPAKEIVVALDAGFAGTGGRSAGSPPLAAKIDAGRGFAGKLVVFSAAGADEIAGALPDQAHGLFTYNFLKGLNGGAGQTEDGVTVQSLFDYLTPKVEDAAGRESRSQTPQLMVPPDGQRQLLIKDLR